MQNVMNTPPQGVANELLAREAETSQMNFRDYLVDLTQEVVRPEYLLEIDGVGLMPRGGITAVAGKAKQGKTQFLAAMVATLMGGKPFGTMKRRAQSVGKILWCDTEQAEFNIHATINRVYRQAGLPQHSQGEKYGLHVLKLRPLDPQGRLLVIKQAVEVINPDVLIIDGIRDLINDFNNIEESNANVGWLLGMLDTRPNMNIICVLHTNEGTEKMRGHLGTELMNKCQDRFTCVKENGIFKVSHNTRDREVLLPFVFCIGAEGALMPSTIEQAEGVMDADAALLAAVPVEGDAWNNIVTAYMKATGIKNQQKARNALKKRVEEGELYQVARGLWKLKNRPQ